MAFTTTDLANVEAALVAISTGERAVMVSIGAKQIRYADTDISELQKLRAIIQTEIGTTQPRAYARNMKRATL